MAIEPEPMTTGSAAPLSREDSAERRVYLAMTAAVLSSFEDFLQPFQSTDDSVHLIAGMTWEDFFPKFFQLANKMTDDCCQKLVKVIRSSSILSTVRETPVPGLAKRIRESAFKSADELLAGYYGSTKKISVVYANIQKIREGMENSAVTGGSPASPSAPSASGGAESQPSGWASEGELGKQQQNLLRLQTQAFSKVVHYLKGLDELPRTMLSYSCDKCFGGEVNYQWEHEQVDTIKAEIKAKLARALETFARVGSLAKQNLDDDRAVIMANLQMQRTHQALDRLWQEKMNAKLKGEQRFRKIAGLALGLLVIFLFLTIGFLWFVMTRR